MKIDSYVDNVLLLFIHKCRKNNSVKNKYKLQEKKKKVIHHCITKIMINRNLYKDSKMILQIVILFHYRLAPKRTIRPSVPFGLMAESTQENGLVQQLSRMPPPE